MFTQRLDRRGFLKVFGVGTATVALAACAAPAASPTAAPSKAAAPTQAPAAKGAAKLAGAEVRLGSPLGVTGAMGDWGKKNRVTLEIVTEEINQAGGIGGLPLKMLIEDTASKPDQAANLVRLMATDFKALALLGPFSSSECEVAFPVGNQLKIPMIANASSKPGVSAANRPYAFRNTVDEEKMAKISMPIFQKTFNIKKVAVVHDVKDAVSKDLGTNVLPKAAKVLGIEVLPESTYVTFSTQDLDFSAQVTKLKGLQFDGILFGGLGGDGVNFLKESFRQGVKQPVIGGTPLINENIPKNAAEAAENRVIASATFWPSMPGDKVQAFVKKFDERAKAAGAPETPEMYDVNIYDEVMLLKSIIENQGITNKPEDLERDREKIMKAISETKDFPGLAGKFGFDQVGDGAKDIHIVNVKGGKFVKVN